MFARSKLNLLLESYWRANIYCVSLQHLNCLLKGWDFFQVFSQVQLNVSSSIKLFNGLLNFADINSKTTHTDASFCSSYSVAMLHFVSNQAPSVDGTLSNCYQSFSISFKLCSLQN